MLVVRWWYNKMEDKMFNLYKEQREEIFSNMLKPKNNSVNIFDLVAKLKVYFQNSTSYLAIANFIMILATFKHTYNINIPVYIIAPLGLLTFLFIGYLDYKLIYLKQATYVNKQNDVKIQLDRIEKLIEDKSK